MAAPRLLSLSRTLFTSTNKQTLTSFLLSRPFSSAASKCSLLRFRPAASTAGLFLSPTVTRFRTFSTHQGQNTLSDSNPNWSNRPPKETILLDGCDFEHWLVVVDKPPENATRDEIIDSYIKTLAQVVGSEEEARMKIYSVSTRHYFAFGALVSEELSLKLKELPHVRWVLPDSYLDVKNKDYGGEPFINGQAVPYDPKYHEEWVRNNAKAQERNRRNDRPRNADRSRNFDRRQQTRNPNPGPPASSNMQGPGGNMGGPPPNNPGFAPNAPPNNPGFAPNTPPNNRGYPPNTPPNSPGYAPNMPPNNPGYAPNMPPNNPGYAPNNTGYAPNMPPNNPGYAQNMPPNNPGYASNMPQNNPGYPQHNIPNDPRSGGGPPPNYGGQGNFGYAGPNQQQGGGMPRYENAPVGNQNYAHNSNMGGQPRDVPGRDGPNY